MAIAIPAKASNIQLEDCGRSRSREGEFAPGALWHADRRRQGGPGAGFGVEIRLRIGFFHGPLVGIAIAEIYSKFADRSRLRVGDLDEGGIDIGSSSQG